MRKLKAKSLHNFFSEIKPETRILSKKLFLPFIIYKKFNLLVGCEKRFRRKSPIRRKSLSFPKAL